MEETEPEHGPLCECGREATEGMDTCQWCRGAASRAANAANAAYVPPPPPSRTAPAQKIPDSWYFLPESSDPITDLLWAYNNTIHIQKREGQSSNIFWGNMTTPPSIAAQNGIYLYDSNQNGFNDLLHRVTATKDATDPELVREEKKSIAEVRKILEKFKSKET